MKKWRALAAICLGTLMLLVDVTIVNVALPNVASDLEASFTDLQWVIDVYALVLAALLLATGTLADAWGRRRVYICGLVIFTMSSLACGLSQNSAELIVARGLQGVGAAAMLATTIALLNVSYLGRDRGVAYGAWGAVTGAAAGLGVVLGGILVEWTSWRWIFFVNLPIAVLTVALSLLAFPADAAQRSVRLDVTGMFTFVIAAGSLTYGMIRAGEYGWTDFGTVITLAVGIVSFGAFLMAERYSANPMVDLNLFLNRSFVGVNLASSALTFGALSYLALLSIWLQTVLGMSALQAGLAFLPLTVTAFIVSGATGRLLNGMPPRWPIAGGMLLIGVGALSMTVIDGESSWLAVIPGQMITGAGAGLAAPAVAAAALGAVTLQRGGMASGLVNTSRQLGLAFGVALLGTVFQSRAASWLTDAGVARANDIARAIAGGGAQVITQADPIGARNVSSERVIESAFASGLGRVFLVAGLVGVFVGIACLFLISGRSASRSDKDSLGSRNTVRRPGEYVGRHRALEMTARHADRVSAGSR